MRDTLLRTLKVIKTKALDLASFSKWTPMEDQRRNRCFKGNIREKEGFIYQETFFTGEFRMYVKKICGKKSPL